MYDTSCGELDLLQPNAPVVAALDHHQHPTRCDSKPSRTCAVMWTERQNWAFALSAAFAFIAVLTALGALMEGPVAGCRVGLVCLSMLSGGLFWGGVFGLPRYNRRAWRVVAGLAGFLLGWVVAHHCVGSAAALKAGLKILAFTFFLVCVGWVATRKDP